MLTGQKCKVPWFRDNFKKFPEFSIIVSRIILDFLIVDTLFNLLKQTFIFSNQLLLKVPEYRLNIRFVFQRTWAIDIQSIYSSCMLLWRVTTLSHRLSTISCCSASWCESVAECLTHYASISLLRVGEQVAFWERLSVWALRWSFGSMQKRFSKYGTPPYAVVSHWEPVSFRNGRIRKCDNVLRIIWCIHVD